MMSQLTPHVLIITSVKMTNNYQRFYAKMNFRLSPYIFSWRQLQQYWTPLSNNNNNIFYSNTVGFKANIDDGTV